MIRNIVNTAVIGGHRIAGRIVCSSQHGFSRTLSQNIPDMPNCDFEPEQYKGPSLEDYKKVRSEHLNPGMFTYYRKPIGIHTGHMQWLWDLEGKRYLDLFGGIVTISVGHCHPTVTAAVEKQLKKLWHTTNIYIQPNINEYAQKLVSTLPENLKVVYFTNSGSEANDMALLMARIHTDTYDVISLRNCYHGASPHLMGLTSLSSWRYNVASGFGYHHTMNPDVYRGPWGGSKCRDSPIQADRKCDCTEGTCQACDNYVDQLEDVMRHSMPKGRAGTFIAEPIQGVGGTVQYPKDYLKRAFDVVRSQGGVCISDEVQTGFGRTGTHYWGFEGHDVTPDIVTMAKGIGNGFPLAAVVTTPEIAATMGRSLHFNTYGGNPLACSAGMAVMDVIEQDNLQQNCHNIGTYMLEKLSDLRNEFEIVGDVRGKGLMIGIEFVEDKKSKKWLDVEKYRDIFESMKDHGILVGNGGLKGTVMRMKPPMCITKEDADFTIATLRKCIAEQMSRW